MWQIFTWNILKNIHNFLYEAYITGVSRILHYFSLRTSMCWMQLDGIAPELHKWLKYSNFALSIGKTASYARFNTYVDRLSGCPLQPQVTHSFTYFDLKSYLNLTIWLDSALVWISVLSGTIVRIVPKRTGWTCLYPYSIRCTNKFPPFFYQKLGIYCERTEPYVLFEVLPIACHYFFPYFWLHTDTTSVECFIFWGYPRIDLIFGIFKWWEVLLRQAILIDRNKWKSEGAMFGEYGK